MVELPASSHTPHSLLQCLFFLHKQQTMLVAVVLPEFTIHFQFIRRPHCPGVGNCHPGCKMGQAPSCVYGLMTDPFIAVLFTGRVNCDPVVVVRRGVSVQILVWIPSVSQGQLCGVFDW